MFRVCATCNGFPVSGNTRLCCRCWRKISEYFSTAGVLIHEPGKVRFGFSWSTVTDGEKKARLLHALKGKTCPRTWRNLAEEFVVQHFNEIHDSKWILIPAPPSIPGEIDHARMWANALAESIHGISVQLLERGANPQEQKVLGRAERRNIEFGLINEDSRAWLKSRLRKGWRVAFVDDVVTTGATAKAAWLTLGKPQPYQVWALSYRVAGR